MSTYLLVNIISISIPLVLSFDRKVGFYRKWRFLFPAIGITMLVFIPWDIIFTIRKIWGFNPEHLSGIIIFHLPLEEWLFFISIPYSSVFIYEVCRSYLRLSPLESYSRSISILLVGFLLITALFNIDKSYTSVSFLFLSLFIVLLEFILKRKYLAWFYFSFLLTLIPFLIVNGTLTGTGIRGEVVWYNNTENLGIRLLTIPVEDIFYGMLLILMNIFIYEFLFEYRSGTSRK